MQGVISDGVWMVLILTFSCFEMIFENVLAWWPKCVEGLIIIIIIIIIIIFAVYFFTHVVGDKLIND